MPHGTLQGEKACGGRRSGHLTEEHREEGGERRIPAAGIQNIGVERKVEKTYLPPDLAPRLSETVPEPLSFPREKTSAPGKEREEHLYVSRKTKTFLSVGKIKVFVLFDQRDGLFL